MENEIKNSISFINEKTGGKSGFSAPSNYFNNLEEEIAIQIAQNNFEKEIAFKVPENYFNNLEDRILSETISEEKETKIISLRKRILKMVPYAAAASIALFLGLNTFVFNSNEQLSIDTLSDNDIEYWLDSNTLNTSDIAAILEDEIIEDNEFSFTEIKDESIEDYINSIDNTSLLNELN